MMHAQEPAKAAPPDAVPTHPLESARYLAWLYSPPQQRPVLAALCAIETEIAASLRPGLDHHVAHTRLQWWREECERCAEGRPVHPMTRELVRAYGAAAAVAGAANTLSSTAVSGAESATASPLAGIIGFADTAVWDLAGATFETRRELAAYCERWAAAMIEPIAAYALAASVVSLPAGTTGSLESDETAAHTVRAPELAAGAMGAPEFAGVGAAAAAATSATTSPAASAEAARAVSHWRVLGAAVREIELLADLAREAHSGRLRVPLDELERAGVDPAGVSQVPWPPSLTALLRTRHETLRAIIAEGVAGLGREEQMASRGLLVWVALAWRRSWRAQRALPNAVSPRRYHALTDGWHAWRAARRAITGNFQLS